MTTGLKRLLLPALSAGIILGAVFSASFIILHLDHECPDHACPVCIQIDLARNVLRALGGTVICYLASLTLWPREPFQPVQELSFPHTMVLLKVQLNC